MKKQKKLYAVIIKASLRRDHYVKYNTSDLLDFMNFLDREYPEWKFMQVYCKQSRRQLGYYTSKDRPTTKTI